MTDRTSPETETLLPCPFCGASNVAIGASQDMKDGEYIEDGRQWSVLCSSCGASCSLYCERAEEAAIAWNMRSGGYAPRPKLPNREQIAKVIYAGWLDADFCTENHFQWFDAGKDNPDSCVHYSNVAKALKVADRVVALSDSSTDRQMNEGGK